MNTRKIFGIGFTLMLCAAPQLSAAVQGCNNGYLLGNYNAEVTNLNLQFTLQALNGTGSAVTPSGTSGGTVTPGSTGSSTGTSGSAVIGFSNNPHSLSGTIPGASRFYFDGAGTIVGVSSASGGSTFTSAVGSYTVNIDCTASMSLTGGATFDAVVADSGKQLVFVETDSANLGSVGTLSRASSCVGLSYPQSYAFSFFGAAPPVASSSTGGTTGSTGGTTGSTGGTTGSTGGTTGSTGGTTGSTGGTTGSTGSAGGGTGTTSSAAFVAFSQIGTISTDGNGSFTMTQTSISNGAVTRSKGGGTYVVGTDCSLKLSFSSGFPGTTSNFVAPTSIGGLTSDSTGGVLVTQPTSGSSPVTGTFIVQ
jgi:hypothetical protein